MATQPQEHPMEALLLPTITTVPAIREDLKYTIIVIPIITLNQELLPEIPEQATKGITQGTPIMEDLRYTRVILTTQGAIITLPILNLELITATQAIITIITQEEATTLLQDQEWTQEEVIQTTLINLVTATQVVVAAIAIAALLHLVQEQDSLAGQINFIERRI